MIVTTPVKRIWVKSDCTESQQHMKNHGQPRIIPILLIEKVCQEDEMNMIISLFGRDFKINLIHI